MVTTVYLFIGMTSAVVLADFYSSRYDDFDIQPLLENARVLQGYTKCFLDEGPCTPDAKDFKSKPTLGQDDVSYNLRFYGFNNNIDDSFLEAIPEALETSCVKCTDKQKQLIRKVIKAVMERHRESWDRLVQKYDPEQKYREGFNKFLEEKQ